MISIIVYGRNDNHGYNLPKRAALSFNCIAETLNDDNDEIVFVDYNTPDDLPTFPEAIADTLSIKAKRYLRILRVRPRFHNDHFADRTHLNAIEPVARNIALRRTRPENRWVLSTNTDMIFIISPAEASLSAIAASLPTAFYHLPRFELPESLWESFHRFEPSSVLKQLSWLPRRYHLEEIVLGHPSILYDGPGDFQLCLRRDLFAIDGFNEQMLLGWHVDSNLAVRLHLLRRQLKTLLPRVRGYHCDHTRQPTVLHAAGLEQNSPVLFIEHVREAYLPAQRRNWGYPSEEFEEIRLGRNDSFTRYNAALTKAIPASQSKPYLSYYTAEEYNRFHFDAEHVLPYVLDVISNLPERSTILLSICSPRLLELMVNGIATVLPFARIIIPDDTPARTDLTVEAERMFGGAFDDSFRIAEVLIFGFPDNYSDESTAQEKATLNWTYRNLCHALENEHRRLSDGAFEPRRFIVVNAVNTGVEELVNTFLSAPLAPFSSRIRHGFLRTFRNPVTPIDTRSFRSELGRSLGRLITPSTKEVHTIEALLTLAKTTLATSEVGTAQELVANHRTPIAAFLSCGGASRLLMDPIRFEALGTLVKTSVNSDSYALEGYQALPRTGGIFDIRDWDDPDWFAWVRRYFGGNEGADWFERRPEVWQRASIMRVLELNGYLVSSAAVLVCCCGHDVVANAIAEHAFTTVACIGSGDELRIADAEAGDNGSFSARLGQNLQHWSDTKQCTFDSIVLPRHVVQRTAATGHSPFDLRLLRKLSDYLRVGGTLIFTLFINFEHSTYDRYLSVDALNGVDFIHTGKALFKVVRPQRLTSSPASRERARNWVVAGRTISRTVVRAEGIGLLEAVIVLERIQ